MNGAVRIALHCYTNEMEEMTFFLLKKREGEFYFSV
jgi:Tat protein secretion system quality control protein TatD with DNase activity